MLAVSWDVLLLTTEQERGDTTGAKEAADQLQGVLKRIDAHPLKALRPLLVQAPLFMSMFFAIRGMTEIPVCSHHYHLDVTIRLTHSCRLKASRPPASCGLLI